MENEQVRDQEVSKSRRILAGILGILVLAIVLFSGFYIAAEADHDCACHDGEHVCPICTCLKQCEAILQFFHSVAAKTVPPVLTVVLLAAAFHITVKSISQETPVSRKVQLNN